MTALEMIQKNWAIVIAVASFVWGYFWITMESRFSKKDDFSRLQDAIKQNDRRVTILEEKFKDAPTGKDLARIEAALERLEGGLNTTNEVLRLTSEQLKLILQSKMHKD